MSSTPAASAFYDGGCTCRHVRHRMLTKPPAQSLERRAALLAKFLCAR